MEEQIGCLWSNLESSLFCLPGENGARPLFNPYGECHPALDLPAAAQIRRDNLRNYFSSFRVVPRVLVVGEAPGWRGCRFSGIPFTSEAQLVNNELPFGGQCSSNSGMPYREASATIFWKTMLSYFPDFLVWNCLPLHPFTPDCPASNRRVSTGEVQWFDHLLRSFIEAIAPLAILAVGREAARALDRLAVSYTPVRHPAHGGAPAFQAGIVRFFGKLGLNPP